MPALKIPNKLKPFLTIPKRFKVAIGGRGGAKSQSISDMLLFLSQTQKHKVGCFREIQNSIEDSVHSLLSDEIERLDLQGFTIQNNVISHKDGGEFRFKGLNRNPDAIKSMHGFTRFWVEEAHSISKESLDKLIPTLRESDSELWFTMNPQSSEDPMSQRFIKPFESELLKEGYYEDDLHLIVWINYSDNPWFPDVLEQDRLWDYKHKSRAEYNHIWLGHFNDSVDNSIIPSEWFDAAIDAHVKLGFEPRGMKVVAHDPSDSGDAKGLAVRHGSVFIDIQENTSSDVNEGCDWALDIAINLKADLFVWDADGLGVTLRRQVASSLDGKKMDFRLFKGSEDPDRPGEPYEKIDDANLDTQKKSNRDTFRNKRAQYYWMLRDRFYKTYLAVEKKKYIDPDELISISSKIKGIEKIRAEVCRIPRKYNNNGLIQITSKQEMLSKYKIESPNMADAMMMSLEIPEKRSKFLEDINYDTRWII